MNKQNLFDKLLTAIEKGNLKVAVRLISRHPDLVMEHFEGHTALHEACINGHLVIVKTLLENGANMDAQDYCGRTPLQLACFCGHVNIVKYLLELGADVNIKTNFNRNALHAACDGDHPELVKLIAEHVSDINAINDTGSTALFDVCDGLGSSEEINLDLVKCLIKHGADPNIVNGSMRNRSPLHNACRNNYLNIVKYLVDQGAKPSPDLLHWAISGDLELIQYLVEELCLDVNNKDDDGCMPFHKLCDQGRLNILKYLSENNKIDIHTKTNDGKTAVHFATNSCHLELVKYLVEKQGMNINTKDNEGITALHLASISNHLDYIKRLIEKYGHGSPCEMQRVDDHFFVNSNNFGFAQNLKFFSYFIKPDLVKYLIEHNADVHAKNNNGYTALHLACMTGHSEVAEVLLEHGADVNSKDNSGKTALHWVCSCIYLDLKLIKCLVEEHNIDLNVIDNEGRTALDEVCKEELKLINSVDRLEAINYLQSKGALAQLPT